MPSLLGHLRDLLLKDRDLLIVAAGCHVLRCLRSASDGRAGLVGAEMEFCTNGAEAPWPEITVSSSRISDTRKQTVMSFSSVPSSH
jgi:hypothetical protein